VERSSRVSDAVVLCLLLVLLVATPVQAALTGYWAFDAGTGTAAVDTIGSSNITLSTASWVTGRVGQFAVHIDSTGPVFGTFAVGVARNKTNLTMAFWVKPGTMATDANAFFEPTVNDATTIRFAIGVPSTGLVWCGGRRSTADVSGSARFLTANVAIPTATWTHVVCVWDGTGGTMALYYNGSPIAGTLSGAGTIGAFATTAPFALPRLGANAAGTTCVCDIDDLQVYDTALSAAEVATLYATYAVPGPLRRTIRY
jgi:hypothetical protein